MLKAMIVRRASTDFLVVMLLVVQAAIWPLCLSLLAWLYITLIPRHTNLTDLDFALVRGCYITSLVLWVGLFSRSIFAPKIEGHHPWRLRPEMGQILHHTVILGCHAALILLVPWQITVAVMQEEGGETLARLLLLLFQSVLLTLIMVIGRRSGPLMSIVLARSHQRQGFLWHIWPFIHLACLGVLLGIMALEAMGYRHAANFVWLHILESLSVIVGLRLFLFVAMVQWVRQIVNSVFSTGVSSGQEEIEEEKVDVEYSQQTDIILRVICYGFLIVLGTVFILEIWGISVTYILMTPFAMQIVPRIVIALITIVGALFITTIINLMTKYWVRKQRASQKYAYTSNRKMRTLIPLFLTLIKVVVSFAAILLILEQFGVATGPLLTGIGIAGIAIGFASQSLVKDIINGMFILFEDSLSVGDLVTLHNVRGIVEKITLRAVTIRDPQGIAHLIPNSTIEIVSNETKDFSCYLLDLQIDGDEDVDEALDVLRRIHEEMRLDPEYAEDLLAPADMVGLERFEGDVVVVRIRLLTRPKRHLDIGREFNRRIKSAFDRQGIQLPSPGYKVALKMQSNTEIPF